MILTFFFLELVLLGSESRTFTFVCFLSLCIDSTNKYHHTASRILIFGFNSPATVKSVCSFSRDSPQICHELFCFGSNVANGRFKIRTPSKVKQATPPKSQNKTKQNKTSDSCNPQPAILPSPNSNRQFRIASPRRVVVPHSPSASNLETFRSQPCYLH